MRPSSHERLPAGSPPRFLRDEQLPRGPELWDPSRTKWTERNTDGLFACEFAEATFRLTKGQSRGELVRLRHWQGDLLCDILRKAASGRRLYRQYDLFIARKNFKSGLGGILALDGLIDEPGAEVYSCAGDKDQAKMVFREVKESVEMSPDLSAIFKVYRDAIEYPALGGVYKALSSESKLKEGLNPSRVLFDEWHVQPSDDLWNVMNQGSDTREAPLTIALTTKGVRTYSDGTDTVCFRGYQYAKKVMRREVRDPNLGARIYETRDEHVDHTDETHWPEANPGLDDFLIRDHMRTRMRQMPEPDFRMKRLNIWVSGIRTWLPGGKFEKLAARRRKPRPGEDAILLFDGSYNNDCTALVAWLLGGPKPHLTLLGLWERPDDAQPDWHVPVAEVEKLIVDTVRGQLLDEGDPEGERLPPRWQTLAVGFDPSRWVRTMMVLEEAGLPIVSIPNSSEWMVPATQAIYQAVMEPAFTHDGNPALERHFRNAKLRMTSKGSQLTKSGQGKIDAAVAAVQGWPLVLQPPAVEESDPADNVW